MDQSRALEEIAGWRTAAVVWEVEAGIFSAGAAALGFQLLLSEHLLCQGKGSP